MTGANSRMPVVVVGGGIFGVSSALALSKLGADVTLVTEGSVADGASGRSLSWLNSARYRSLDYHRLRLAGLKRYRELSAEIGNVPWLRFNGGLTWDADNEGNRIAEVFDYERSIDYPARLLKADEVASVTPGVEAAAIPPQGAIFNPDEGWVDLPSLIGCLLGRFRQNGGKLVERTGKARINVAHGRVSGVTTADGRKFETQAALLATGADVPGMVAEFGQTIPDATPIALLVRTKPASTQLQAVLNTPRAAVRPAPDGTLVIDHGWAEREVINHGNGRYEAKDSTIQGLLDEASAVLAGKLRLELASFAMGPKPIPKDGDPVLGELDGIQGYFVAFSHSGATLGLIAGELLAKEIVHGVTSPLLNSFRPSRLCP